MKRRRVIRQRLERRRAELENRKRRYPDPSPDNAVSGLSADRGIARLLAGAGMLSRRWAW